jgi:similar to stage IV sporulation protein
MGHFITACAKSGLDISDIHRIDGITVKLCVLNRDFEEFVEIADKFGAKYCVQYKKGIINTFTFINGRKFFVVGFLLFLLIIFINASLVRDISVKGNETVSEQEVLDMLKDYGFKKGTLIYNLDKKQIQQEVMRDYNQFAWLWIHLEGNKAFVTVKERTPKPDMVSAEDYSNCVASRDGVVLEIMPRTGRQIVKTGDVVKAGDLLISGMSETKTGEIRYVHADGIVKAKTWYSAKGVYNHNRTDRHLTGRKNKLYFLDIGGYRMPVGSDEIGFDKYDVSETKKVCPFLNLSFTICTYCEIIEENVTIDDEEAVASAKKVLTKQLNDELSSKESLVIDTISSEWITNSMGNIEVMVTFECTEDIAMYQSLDKPEILMEEQNGENSTV